MLGHCVHASESGVLRKMISATPFDESVVHCAGHDFTRTTKLQLAIPIRWPTRRTHRVKDAIADLDKALGLVRSNLHAWRLH